MAEEELSPQEREVDQKLKKQAAVDKAPKGGRADGGNNPGFTSSVLARIRRLPQK